MAVLRQPLVLSMSADPIPSEAAAFKFANGTIVDAYAHTPFAATDLFKVQRRMKWFFAPKLIIFFEQDCVPLAAGDGTASRIQASRGWGKSRFVFFKNAF